MERITLGFRTWSSRWSKRCWMRETLKWSIFKIHFVVLQKKQPGLPYWSVIKSLPLIRTIFHNRKCLTCLLLICLQQQTFKNKPKYVRSSPWYCELFCEKCVHGASEYLISVYIKCGTKHPVVLSTDQIWLGRLCTHHHALTKRAKTLANCHTSSPPLGWRSSNTCLCCWVGGLRVELGAALWEDAPPTTMCRSQPVFELVLKKKTVNVYICGLRGVDYFSSVNPEFVRSLYELN